MTFFDVLSLVGGIALFLYGMDVLGKSLEKAAGSQLKSILSKLTNSTIKGLLLGVAVTAVIQSSAATTVMVVGFVNSGLMQLGQAVGVIMGANIGTTVTAWILSLNGISGSSFFIQLLNPMSFTPILAIIGVALQMFYKLDAVDTIKFSGLDSDGWYIDSARKAIESGRMLYAGKYSKPDYELLVSENCSLAIENTMITHSPQVTEKLKSFDIPSIIEYSSYEEEPLGRVEWVKFFGALTDRDEKADELFNEQVNIVNRIAKTDGTDTAANADSRPTVAFFYITSNGQVQVRKSTDYVPKMISLAGGKYIFDASNDDDTGRSTMNMQLEDFYNGAIDADYLIYNSAIDGGVKNLNELLDKCPVLADFRAVKDGNVFCTTNDMYQQSMSIGYMIDDMHSMITGAPDSGMKYLFKLR